MIQRRIRLRGWRGMRGSFLLRRIWKSTCRFIYEKGNYPTVSNSTSRAQSKHSTPESTASPTKTVAPSAGTLSPSRPILPAAIYSHRTLSDIQAIQVNSFLITGTSIWADRDKQLIITLLTNRVFPTDISLGIIEARAMIADEIVKAWQKGWWERINCNKVEWWYMTFYLKI